MLVFGLQLSVLHVELRSPASQQPGVPRLPPAEPFGFLRGLPALCSLPSLTCWVHSLRRTASRLVLRSPPESLSLSPRGLPLLETGTLLTLMLLFSLLEGSAGPWWGLQTRVRWGCPFQVSPPTPVPRTSLLASRWPWPGHELIPNSVLWPDGWVMQS